MTRTEIDVTVRQAARAARRRSHPVLAAFALAFGLCFLVVAWKIAVPALALGIVMTWVANRG